MDVKILNDNEKSISSLNQYHDETGKRISYNEKNEFNGWLGGEEE